MPIDIPPLTRLVPPLGAALLTRRLAESGGPVGRMVRSEPHNAADSGWTFTRGDEPPAELADPSRIELWDVDDVVRIDPDVLAFLTWPPGAEIAREGPTAPLRVVDSPEGEPEARLLPPVEEGEVPLGGAWLARSPTGLLRRMHGDDLVFSRDGLSVWVAAFTGGADPQERLDEVEEGLPPDATDVRRHRSPSHCRLDYVRELDGERLRYAFVRLPARELHVSAASTTAAMHAVADQLCGSIRPADLG